MARVTSNRKVEDLGNGVKRSDKFDAPAFESEAARLDHLGPLRHANLAIDLAAVACTSGGVDADAPAYIVAGRAGVVDSIVFDLSAAVSAGGTTAFQAQLTVNGTVQGDVFTVASGGASAISSVVDQTTAVAYNEGDKLSIAVTTSHTFAPTTADFAAWIVARYAA